jgi:hypothetical protein
MKSPNCSATAPTLACIEFRGRLTAGAVSGLPAGSHRPLAPVALIFEPFLTSAGDAVLSTLRRASLATSAGLDAAWRATPTSARIALLEAPVAQLDRALPSEGRGQGFESLRVRQIAILDCLK